MLDNFHESTRLQYWTHDHDVREGNSIEFDAMEDAIAYAMTQRPCNMEIAWIHTQEGMTLMPSRIATLWELRRKPRQAI